MSAKMLEVDLSGPASNVALPCCRKVVAKDELLEELYQQDGVDVPGERADFKCSSCEHTTTVVLVDNDVTDKELVAIAGTANSSSSNRNYIRQRSVSPFGQVPSHVVTNCSFCTEFYCSRECAKKGSCS